MAQAAQDKRTVTITTASPPFDNPNADIILRSSDGVDFHVFRLILSLASPVFETMFSLPQPEAAEWAQGGEKGPPVIEMTEDKGTLDTILRFCYPVSPPTMLGRSIEDVFSLLNASTKYQMDWLLSSAKSSLLFLVHQDPAAVFAIAYHHRLKEEAQNAARYSLLLPHRDLLSARPILRHIAVNDYNRLLRYHNDCGDAVRQLDPSPGNNLYKPWMSESDCRILRCPNARAGMLVRLQLSPGSSNCLIHSWFVEFMRRACAALARQPASSIISPTSFYADLLKECAECSYCNSTLVFPDLVKLFFQRADKVISEVPLDLGL